MAQIAHKSDKTNFNMNVRGVYEIQAEIYW